MQINTLCAALFVGLAASRATHGHKHVPRVHSRSFPLLPRFSNDSSNPFENRQITADPSYVGQLDTVLQGYQAAGDAASAAIVEAAQNAGTFFWISNVDSLSDIDTAAAASRQSGSKEIVGLVAYDLPDRDCSAGDSAGEFSVADGGLELYKTNYIDVFAQKLAASSDVSFAVVIEPDAIANAITGTSTPLCVEAKPAYEEGIAYAISKLSLPNVSLYVDAGNNAWLGELLEEAAQEFALIVNQATSDGTTSGKIRGFSVNVSNYYPFQANSTSTTSDTSATADESSYINQLSPYLSQVGLPQNFIVDQSRVATDGIASGDWCNISPAGFGILPGTPVDNAYVDSIVWVKPGGQSDGQCGLSGAPAAGQFFPAYVQMLVQNANPSV